MGNVNWALGVFGKAKKMRKGDAETIPCPTCGEFIQIYKLWNGRIRCECGKCGKAIRQ